MISKPVTGPERALAAGAWAGTAAAYEVSFARLCVGTATNLLALLEPTSRGRSLLDVGCGPGTLVAAARRAGFEPVGVDADPSMLALSRQRHPGVSVVRGALPRLPFAQDRFDAVAANFVVNHTPDPRASVRELARVTRPGGRVAVTIWPAGVSPLNQLWNDVLDAASVPLPAATTLPAERDFERTAAGLTDLVQGAGLREVSVCQVEWVFDIPADDLWRAVDGGIARIGQAYRAQDDATRNRMRAAYQWLTADRHAGLGSTPGRLRLPTSSLLAGATAVAG